MSPHLERDPEYWGLIPNIPIKDQMAPTSLLSSLAPCAAGARGWTMTSKAPDAPKAAFVWIWLAA